MNFNDRTWAEVDLDAIEYNYRTVRSSLPKGTKTCCVVKGNAYGHGAVRVAKLLSDAGADFFAVSNIDEALILRRAGIETRIVVLGYTPPSRAAELASNNISQCVFSSEYAKNLADYAEKDRVKLTVHMKIDTGMGRLGFIFRHSADESLEELCEACSYSCFILEGIFTHFPTADEETNGETKERFERFCEVIEALGARGYRFEIRHCANSATSLRYPEFSLDMVRLGIILYGALPSDNMPTDFKPRATMSLKTVVSNIKLVRKGDTIGYGATFAAPEDMKIATLPLGYADGFLRSNSDNGTPILIKGRRCRIVGRICMDQLMVDVDNIPDISAGDVVTVFGEEGISVSELARCDKTIPYEILCMIGARVPRCYRKNGRIENP